ncbi:type IV toxin-antitoxin system AbiEi family antitoxin domain-containing protein [Roseomonas sp. USHLN139]|uniref:type IV toxin-antitoxin system AbiEi family antitoxin domain-containing protein n=1 Tax=Roseomonas sp. USHLN139 TaxID=3081298 RepID=UPI003B01FF5B
MTQQQQLQDLLADGSVWRSSMLRSRGIRPQAIADALAAGHVAQVSRGFYYRPDSGVAHEFASLIAACGRMSQGLACLLSAAHLAGLSSQPPKQPWIALPPGVHGSSACGQSGRLLRWSYEGAFEIGVEERRIGGTVIRYTGPARTLIDLVRYGRHMDGLATAAEAARSFVTGGGMFAEVVIIAEKLRVPDDTLRRLEALQVTIPMA